METTVRQGRLNLPIGSNKITFLGDNRINISKETIGRDPSL